MTPSLVLAALALAPQIQTPSPTPGAAMPSRRAVPALVYPSYPNGGRVTQLGLPHAAGIETFGLFRPGALPQQTPQARPLLVLFHSFGGDGDAELEAWTEFSDEADQRYWYVLAPDQDVPSLGFLNGSPLRRKTYGIEAAQQRFALALRWVLATYPIDRMRIYGVGFSMGGGDLLSFAAQYQDPSDFAFAAVATNAGTLCLSEEYWRNPNPGALAAVVGGGAGPNPQNRFAYERLSALLYANPYGPSALDLGRRHPVENLRATPLQAWVDVREPSAQLLGFHTDLDVLLGPSVVGGAFERFDVLGTASSAHVWETFDYWLVCERFGAARYSTPLVADLCVTRDARYGEVSVTRVTAGAFGELSYDLTQIGQAGALDRARIVDCVNIATARFDGGVHGLGMSTAYELEVEGNPTRDWLLAVDHVPAPNGIFRNGVDVASLQNVWAYDPATQTLRVLATAGQTTLWTIQ